MPESEMTPLHEAPPSHSARTSTRKRLWRKKLLYLVAAESFHVDRAKPPKGWVSGSKALALGSKLNALTLFVLFLPLCWKNEGARFGLAGIVLLPLAAMLGEVTEKVAYHTSDTVGGLLNASFGNATEVIVSIFALRKGLTRVVQVSLLGSVLSNMLLVLGCAFIAAGLKQKVAKFNAMAATANTSLLLVAVMALLVPALLTATGSITPGGENAFSRLVAALMLGTYAAYLFFQLSTHQHLFAEDDEELGEQLSEQQQQQQQQQQAAAAVIQRRRISGGSQFAAVVLAASKQARIGPFAGTPPPPAVPAPREEEDDGEDFVLSLNVAIGWLAAITVAIAVLSEIITGALEGAAQAWHLPEAFVGFVLLPIVGNAAEHATAVSMAYREKVDLAIAVALGSSTQIALFVIPLMVLLGWAIGSPLDLAFGGFETAVTALSVLIVSSQAQLGEAHYLNGIILVVAYCIISIAFVFVTDGH